MTPLPLVWSCSLPDHRHPHFFSRSSSQLLRAQFWGLEGPQPNGFPKKEATPCPVLSRSAPFLTSRSSVFTGPPRRHRGGVGSGGTGHCEVMRAALECAHRGWGESCIIGVAAAGKARMLGTRSVQQIQIQWFQERGWHNLQVSWIWNFICRTSWGVWCHLLLKPL